MEGTTTFGGPALDSAENKRKPPLRQKGAADTAFGAPRDYLDNQFVYTVVCARARGLAVAINLCPEKECNFSCIYCEVHRNGEAKNGGKNRLDIEVMAIELKRTLALVRAGRLRDRPWYHSLPDELLQLRHVAVCGDGEPTFAERFTEAMQAILHVRAVGEAPFFKLVLLTNGTCLDQPNVQLGLRHLTLSDEIWVKLDGGTQNYVNRINRSSIPLEKVLSNILLVGRARPIVIQSLFPALNGEEPPLEEIEQYATRLLELKNEGAQISSVQVYSATRPSPNSQSGHLPLRTLSKIANIVRQIAGLKTEVF